MPHLTIACPVIWALTQLKHWLMVLDQTWSVHKLAITELRWSVKFSPSRPAWNTQFQSCLELGTQCDSIDCFLLIALTSLAFNFLLLPVLFLDAYSSVFDKKLVITIFEFLILTAISLLLNFHVWVRLFDLFQIHLILYPKA